MLTVGLLILPLIASLVLVMTKGDLAKKLAIGFSLSELILAIIILLTCKCKGFHSFTTSWIGSVGASFSVSLTGGIESILVLLTSILIPLIVISTYKNKYENAGSFYALIFAMQTGLIGVFVAQDSLLFYVFWELALIPVYFICALWGGENRIKVTFKFLIYTVLGSLFMLGGILYIYTHTSDINSNHSFLHIVFNGVDLSPKEQIILFWAFFIAFAIKMPIFPFHTWQPDTYTTAPTAGTMLLSGIMLKMGIFGVIKWILPILPYGFKEWQNVVIILSLIGVLYAAVIALQQTDMKRLVAYSSISHVGLIVIGVFVASHQSLQGAVIQMFNHGINVVGMFFIIEIIFQRLNTRTITSLGGIINNAPKLAVFFVIIMLGNIALPLTNGFAGEFLLLNSLYSFNPTYAALAGLSVILGAFYSLRMYQRVMLGESNSLTENFTDVTVSEMFVLVPICAIIIITGIYPKLLLDLSDYDSKSIIDLLITKHGK